MTFHTALRAQKGVGPPREDLDSHSIRYLEADRQADRQTDRQTDRKTEADGHDRGKQTDKIVRQTVEYQDNHTLHFQDALLFPRAHSTFQFYITIQTYFHMRVQ